MTELAASLKRLVPVPAFLLIAGPPDFGHDLVLKASARRWPAGSLFAIAEVAH
jgi:hypothetical protein